MSSSSTTVCRSARAFCAFASARFLRRSRRWRSWSSSRAQVLLEPVHLAGRVAVLGRHAAAAALVVLQHARVARLAVLAAPARRRRRPAVAGPVLLAVVLLALLLLQVVQALPVVLGDVRHMVVVFNPILINKCPIRIHLQQSGW